MPKPFAKAWRHRRVDADAPDQSGGAFTDAAPPETLTGNET